MGCMQARPKPPNTEPLKAQKGKDIRTSGPALPPLPTQTASIQNSAGTLQRPPEIKPIQVNKPVSNPYGYNQNSANFAASNNKPINTYAENKPLYNGQAQGSGIRNSVEKSKNQSYNLNTSPVPFSKPTSQISGKKQNIQSGGINTHNINGYSAANNIQGDSHNKYESNSKLGGQNINRSLFKDDDNLIPEDSLMEYGQTTIDDPTKIQVHFHV